MSSITEIINILNKKIKKLYSGFNGTYLYGSYALGTETKNSDVDIVAIFDRVLSRDERLKLWGLVGNIEATYDIIFDIHPMSESELKQNPVYYNQVVNKGIFYGV